MAMNNETGGTITTLLLDIGGVLLSNGWGHESRYRAVEKFGLDKVQMEDRHRMTFDTFEMDRMTFDEYMNWVVFYEPRNFTKEEFKMFMFSQSQALDGHIDFFKMLKHKHGLRVFAVSNENRELNEYRIQKFGLDSLFDGYISSCYVRLHKPDKEMLRLACDISHTKPVNALYIDDSRLLVDVAKSYGLQTLHFQDLDNAKKIIDTLTFKNKN